MPIFDGFTLYNKQKAAEAALEQAEAEYRATVITAFQNVADALRALQADARAIKAAVHAEDTAKASLEIVQKQLNAGQVNQLAVLNAQQTYLTAAVIRVQTEANRLSDTAALFMALGGGWPVGCTTPVLAGMRDRREFHSKIGVKCTWRLVGDSMPFACRYVRPSPGCWINGGAPEGAMPLPVHFLGAHDGYL